MESNYSPPLWPKPPANTSLQWELLNPSGDGKVSFYTYDAVSNPDIQSPWDLSANVLADYMLQGSVIINGQLWNYVGGEEEWRENSFVGSCSPQFASATQCVVPLQFSTSNQPVTGAVNRDGDIPLGPDQLIYIQVVNGKGPFYGDGLLVNTKDECPGCSPLQVDILYDITEGDGLPYSYNLGSDSWTVYIWIAQDNSN